MMMPGFKKIFITVAVFLLLAVTSFARAAVEEAPEKVLGLEKVMLTHYALGGDTAGQKSSGEALYISKGTPAQALANLREIVTEGKKPVWSFNMRDQIEIIIFRGVFLNLRKVGIKKVVLKDSVIEIYAEYKDFPGSDVATQPAAIIPAGHFLPGKYTAILFVDNKLQKKVDFRISR